MKDKIQIKKTVKKVYSTLVQSSGCCCKCKGVTNFAVQRQTQKINYSHNEMQEAPDGSNLGLGCGNPTAIASLKKGEVVLDLGCGAGFDVFLAANKVGNKGKAIGVDFSKEMLAKARANAEKGNYKNVEFIKSDIEKIAVEAKSVDVVISNCVINLSPNKDKVFKEAYRVLKNGGRLMLSDVLLIKPLTEEMRQDEDLLTGCIAGAVMKEEYLGLIKKAGFKAIKIEKETPSYLEDYAVSVTVSAKK